MKCVFVCVCVCVWVGGRLLRKTSTHYCSHRHKLSHPSVLTIWVAELIKIVILMCIVLMAHAGLQ
jgi:hypothetical protein